MHGQQRSEPEDERLAAFAGHDPALASPLARVAAAERADVFRVGVLVSLVCALSGLTYSLLTWEQPYRGAIVAVSVAGALGGVLPGWLVLRHRSAAAWWPRFELVWSALAAVAISAIVLLDGGARSPFVAGLLLVQLYASLFYSTRKALISGAGTALLMLAIVAVSPAAERPIGIAVLFGLPLAAGMAVFHARVQRRSREELDRLARMDALTGVLNRRGFAEAMELAVVDAGVRERSLVLVFADLDGFKGVNDAHGHAAGDHLLRWVGTALAAAPDVEAVGRVGGDEFAALVSPAPGRSAENVVAELRSVLRRRTAVSIGAATFPGEARASSELLALADERAYREKAAGGGGGGLAAVPSERPG